MLVEDIVGARVGGDHRHVARHHAGLGGVRLRLLRLVRHVVQLRCHGQDGRCAGGEGEARARRGGAISKGRRDLACCVSFITSLRLEGRPSCRRCARIVSGTPSAIMDSYLMSKQAYGSHEA